MRERVAVLSGVRIPLGPHLSRHVLNSLAQGLYERQERRILRHVLEPSDRILEGGTGVGLISTYCSLRVGADRVFTYEANPLLEPVIREVYLTNNVAPQLRMCSLSTSEGLENIFVTDDLWGSSALKPNGQSRRMTVPAKQFSRELAEINPTLLILDVEGAEYDLLINEDLGNVQKLLVEIHGSILGPEKVERLLTHLNQLGFRIDHEKSFRLVRRLADRCRPLFELLLSVGLRVDAQPANFLSRQHNLFLERHA